MTEESLDAVRRRLLEAAVAHVAFDGWGAATFDAAVADSGTDPVLARVACPRGAIDLAHAFHVAGDRRLINELGGLDLSALPMRERVAKAVRLRIELAGGREEVRRGMTLFSLPLHAAEGTGLVWGTADAIWVALGDRSDDLSWYTRRASLSGVFGSTVLFWLGDDSPGAEASWAFLDRRIGEVLRIEKLKSGLRSTPVLGRLMAGPDWLSRQVHPPRPRDDLPGRMSD